MMFTPLGWLVWFIFFDWTTLTVTDTVYENSLLGFAAVLATTNLAGGTGLEFPLYYQLYTVGFCAASW